MPDAAPRVWRLLWAWAGGLGLVAALGWNDVDVTLAHWVAHALVVGALMIVWRFGAPWTPRLAEVARAAGFALAANACTAPLAYAAVRTDVVLRDSAFARFDAVIGLDVPSVRSALLYLPLEFWWRVYGLLVPMLVLTVIVLTIAHPARARRFLLAYIASFTLALPVMALVQAEGPWVAHGFVLTPEQASYVEEFNRLKVPGTFVYDPTRTTGVITFPSFHTVLAALTAWGLAPVRYIGPVAVLIATGIVLATVATGWHYVADVLGGLVVLGAAIGLATRIERALGSTLASSPGNRSSP